MNDLIPDLLKSMHPVFQVIVLLLLPVLGWFVNVLLGFTKKGFVFGKIETMYNVFQEAINELKKDKDENDKEHIDLIKVVTENNSILKITSSQNEEIFKRLTDHDTRISHLEIRVESNGRNGHAEEAPERKIHVLIVDDQISSFEGTIECLRGKGLHVTGCQNRLEAEKLLNKCHFDVALIDLYMQDELGTDLIRYINEAYPHIKTQLFTAKDPDEIKADYADKFFKIEESSIMSKDLNSDTIYKRITSLF